MAIKALDIQGRKVRQTGEVRQTDSERDEEEYSYDRENRIMDKIGRKDNI